MDNIFFKCRILGKISFLNYTNEKLVNVEGNFSGWRNKR